MYVISSSRNREANRAFWENGINFSIHAALFRPFACQELGKQFLGFGNLNIRFIVTQSQVYLVCLASEGLKIVCA